MKLRRKPAQGRLFSSSMLGGAVGVGVSAVTTFATARILGAEGRGQIAVLTVVASYAIVALGISLESGVLYYGGQTSADGMKLLRQRVAIIVGWTMLACAITIFFATQHSGVPMSFWACFVFALGSASTIAVAPVTAFDRVEGHHHAATWRAIWALVAQQAGGLAGLAIGSTVESYLLASGACALLVTVLLVALHARASARAGAPSLTSDLPSEPVPCPSIREILTYSAKGHAGVLLHLYAMRVPLIVLSISAGAAAAGKFSIASAIVELVLIVTGSQLAYVLAAATTDRNDYSVLKSQLRLGFYLSLVVGAALVPVSWAASRFLGPDFFGVQLTVAILTPGVIALGLWRLASYDLASRGFANLRSLSGLVGALVITVLVFALAGPFGTNGVAAAASLGFGAMLASLGLLALPHIRRVTA